MTRIRTGDPGPQARPPQPRARARRPAAEGAVMGVPTTNEPRACAVCGRIFTPPTPAHRAKKTCGRDCMIVLRRSLARARRHNNANEDRA